jgi:hypothetical protein
MKRSLPSVKRSLPSVKRSLPSVKRSLPLVALAVLVLIGVWLVWSESRTGRPVDLVSSPPALAASEVVSRAPTIASGTSGRELAAALERVDEEPDETHAELAVSVISREQGRPLAGIGVRVFRTEKDPIEGGLLPYGNQDVRTDEHGLAVARVPARQRFRLSTVRSFDAKWTTQELGPFEPGERSELRIEVETDRSLRFFGRVVAETDRTPVADVLVSTGDPDPSPAGVSSAESRRIETSTDTGGNFEIDAPPWIALAIKLEKPGFAPRLVPLTEGHENPSSALEIPLVAGASLRVRVADELGRVPAGALLLACEVSDAEWLMTDGTQAFGAQRASQGGKSRWTSSLAPDGTGRIEGLPVRIDLSLTVLREQQPLPMRKARVALQPAKEKSIQLRVEERRTIRGRVVETGNGIANCDVWLVDSRRAERDLTSSDYPELVARTDEKGEFTLAPVLAGSWAIALAPYSTDSQRVRSNAEFFAPPVRVEIRPGTPIPDVVIQAERGLTIRGIVLDASGVPCIAGVRAGNEGSPSLRQCTSDDHGRFTVGPLRPGEYAISAHCAGFGGKGAPSDPVRARAGSEDVVLRLRAGAVIRGIVVDESGAAVGDPELVLFLGGPESRRWQRSLANEAGRFEFRDLEPGRIRLVGSTLGGLFGSSDEIDATASTASEIRLVLRPGARLRVRGNASVEVLQAGLPVAAAEADLRRGAVQQIVVPPGRLTIASYAPGDRGAPAMQEVEVAPRAVAEVTAEVPP